MVGEMIPDSRATFPGIRTQPDPGDGAIPCHRGTTLARRQDCSAASPNLDQGFRRARVPFSVCFGCGEMEQPDDRDPIALQQIECKFFVQSAGVHARNMPD
jgi:hypothetical protein